MKKTYATLVLLVTGAVSAAACTEEVRTASPTVEPRQSAASAAETIASADCDREERCGNIGQGRSFSTPAQCAQAKYEPISRELSDPDCNRNGVADADLDQCVMQIGSRGCSNISTAGFWKEMIECGSGNLCLE